MDTDRLRGIIPPLTMPFDDRGGLDLAGLERNLARYERARLAGYLLFGSNGEAVHLDRDERALALAAVRRHLGPDRLVLAGINAQATREAIREIATAAAAGADAALVITPYFYQGSMSQEVLRGFFTDVADASPLPVLVYNIPQNTGVRVAPATVAALAGHERIIGTKDSSGDFAALAETVRRVEDEGPGARHFRVLVGNAAILHPALVAGAAGGILAAACALPEACVAIFDAVHAGDHDRAGHLQRRLAPIGRLVTAEYGVPGLKAALDRLGFAGGAPRPPLRPLDAAGRAMIELAIDASGLAA